MLPLCQRVTRQYESLARTFGVARRSGNIKFKRPFRGADYCWLASPCRDDVNLRKCSVGRVYIDVYNYIWRDIKRWRNRARPMNDDHLAIIHRPSYHESVNYRMERHDLILRYRDKIDYDAIWITLLLYYTRSRIRSDLNVKGKCDTE